MTLEISTVLILGCVVNVNAETLYTSGGKANNVAPLSAWHTTNLVACHRINRYTVTKE